MNTVAQIKVVTAMNLRAIPQRKGASAVIVIGMACVVGVVLSVLSLSEGFVEAMGAVAPADQAVVMMEGALFPSSSQITRENAVTAMDAEGIRKTADGKPIASAEFYANVPVTKKKDGFDTVVTLVGMSAQGSVLNAQNKIVAGRMFEPAVHELIVGRSLQTQFEGLELGQIIPLPEGNWSIVGVYAATHPMAESAVIGDTDTLSSAFRRQNYNAVRVQLESPDAFDRFKASLTTNPSLSVQVRRQSEVIAEQGKPLADLLRFIGITLGIIMGAGAVFGALNTMYTAVSTRRREIATLRAIGFGATPVVISVLAEALMLALVGAVIGGAVAWAAFNGNTHTAGGGVFYLRISGGLLVVGVVIALVIGFFGGLFPAIRAARLPIIDALRAR